MCTGYIIIICMYQMFVFFTNHNFNDNKKLQIYDNEVFLCVCQLSSQLKISLITDNNIICSSTIINLEHKLVYQVQISHFIILCLWLYFLSAGTDAQFGIFFQGKYSLGYIKHVSNVFHSYAGMPIVILLLDQCCSHLY